MIDRTTLARAHERIHRRPLEEVVREVCARHSRLEDAAEEMQVSVPTMRVWKMGAAASLRPCSQVALSPWSLGSLLTLGLWTSFVSPDGNIGAVFFVFK